jgi:hypothetical protein
LLNASILEAARENLARNSVRYTGDLPPLGARWEAYARRTTEEINSFKTAQEVIHAAQSPQHGFESRRPAEYLARVADDIEERLAIDFPQYAIRFGFASGFALRHAVSVNAIANLQIVLGASTLVALRCAPRCAPIWGHLPSEDFGSGCYAAFRKLQTLLELSDFFGIDR